MIDHNTWIISDTHLGHNNIIRFCNRPMNHEDIIISNWARTVAWDDTILHLGDVAFGNKESIEYWANRIKYLPGRKFLVKGNHDHSRSIKIYKDVFEIVNPFVQDFSDVKFLFSHYPDQHISQEWDINIHGHIHNNPLNSKFSPQVSPDKLYENVSVEVINYTPIRLSDILLKWGVPF